MSGQPEDDDVRDEAEQYGDDVEKEPAVDVVLVAVKSEMRVVPIRVLELLEVGIWYRLVT